MLETIAGHLDFIAGLSPGWKLLLVFAFMAVESSFIPFPSEVVMIPAGFFAARGELLAASPVVALALCVAIGVAGSLAGAYVNYFLALRLGLGGIPPRGVGGAWRGAARLDAPRLPLRRSRDHSSCHGRGPDMGQLIGGKHAGDDCRTS